MDKFGRNYLLQVGTQSVGIQNQDIIAIRPPFTMEFDVNRRYGSSSNSFDIRVYNLSPKNRNKIRKDTISFQLGSEDFRPISLAAGYGDKLSEIVKGNIIKAWSMREGTNFITSIEGFDAGFAFANGITSTQYQAGTPTKTIIADLMKSLAPYGVATGAIGDFPGELSRANSFYGNTTDILRELTGGGFCIDNGTAHALQDDECLDDGILLISSEAGLLGTPRREATNVYVNIIFEPKVKLNQLVQIQSVTDKTFNDTYRVMSIHHKGVISEVVSGEATTELGLTIGKFDPIRRFQP